MSHSISRPISELSNAESGARSSDHRNHTVLLSERNRLEITGVTDVLRFDDLCAELATSLGDLFIDGEALRMESYDTERGIVTLSGKFRTLDYSDSDTSEKNAEKKRVFFGKRR